jgi:hypothetical protein
MSQLGPITAALEEEVTRELRQRGIVVWLDKDGSYTAYVDALADRYKRGEFFAPVVAFRGSYLAMMLALEPYGNGLDPEPLLIHMPGHTEESIRTTPLLELYRAGRRFRKALHTLIREAANGRVGPADIDHYLASAPADLAAAEAWLHNATSQARAGLAGHLDSLTLEWLLDGLLGKEKVLHERVCDAETLDILLDHLYRHTGMDAAFLQFFNGGAAPTFTNVAEACAGWLLCVEFVHDLARPPHLEALRPIARLAAPLRKTCARLVAHLRAHHPDTYVILADGTEGILQGEFDAMQPADFGPIDTFRSEETRVLAGALQALQAAEWDNALHWATSRLEHTSFWLQRDPAQRLVWTLVRDAAILGQAMAQAGRPLQTGQSLHEALVSYTTTGFEVDKAHRRFEQQRFKLLDAQLPHFAQLLEVANDLRGRYRAWADQLAEDFTNLCTTVGFLPDSREQQRTLYDQVVHPLTQRDNKVAYFLIDALRFEMATELQREFEDAGTTVHLTGRYAELPSITPVGMNALAPVARAGRLTLAGGTGFHGFKTGEYAVRRPEERVRAMGDRSVNNVRKGRKKARGVSLSDVCTWSTTSLKKSCGDADLIVVHSKEIDDAGEANVGLATFETWLQQITSAWSHLKTIGVNVFVFTADHGFLLLDHTTQEVPYGTKRDPNRRHILSPEARAEVGMVNVSLNALGYDGQEGYVLLRRDTAVFATGKSGATFVHGGNSLQERVIPVLTVSHRHRPQRGLAQYLIEAEALPELLGYSRLRVRVKPSLQLSFVGAPSIALALRVPERPDVQVTIKEAIGAEVSNQVVRMAGGEAWVEVLFDLRGPQDERVRVELFHPEAVERIEPCTIEAYFNVAGTGHRDDTVPVAPVAAQEWQQNFEDAAVREVFLHLQQHGAVTEQELTHLLGSPRRVRRFALAFDDYVQKVPFAVRIETTNSGKRYVKQN